MMPIQRVAVGLATHPQWTDSDAKLNFGAVLYENLIESSQTDAQHLICNRTDARGDVLHTDEYQIKIEQALLPSYKEIYCVKSGDVFMSAHLDGALANKHEVREI